MVSARRTLDFPRRHAADAVGYEAATTTKGTMHSMEAKLARLTADLREMVEQDCGGHEGGYLNSKCTTAYARAMRTLAELGEIRIASDDGSRQVTGHWTKAFWWRDHYAPKSKVVEDFCKEKGIKFKDISGGRTMEGFIRYGKDNP